MAPKGQILYSDIVTSGQNRANETKIPGFVEFQEEVVEHECDVCKSENPRVKDRDKTSFSHAFFRASKVKGTESTSVNLTTFFAWMYTSVVHYQREEGGVACIYTPYNKCRVYASMLGGFRDGSKIMPSFTDGSYGVKVTFTHGTVNPDTYIAFAVVVVRECVVCGVNSCTAKMRKCKRCWAKGARSYFCSQECMDSNYYMESGHRNACKAHPFKMMDQAALCPIRSGGGAQ